MKKSQARATAVACALLLVPAIALAGPKVTGGGASLQLKMGVTPAKAGAKGVKVSFFTDYESTNGKRLTAFTKEIKLTLADGMKLHPTSAPQCDGKKLDQANGDPKVCPAASLVGNGTFTADARPLVAKPVSGTAKAYNEVFKGRPQLLLYVSAKVGSLPVHLDFYFDTGTTHGGKAPTLDLVFSKPKPGDHSTFTVKTVKLTLHNSSTGRPFVDAPSTCSGGWAFSVFISSYSKAPGLTAHDSVPCTA